MRGVKDCQLWGKRKIMTALQSENEITLNLVIFFVFNQ